MFELEIENTPKETFDFMVKVLAVNHYTGKVTIIETEGDVDWEDDRDEFRFFVKNELTGNTKQFNSIWDAFDYRDTLWNKFNINIA